jgi:hypothetical protein
MSFSIAVDSVVWQSFGVYGSAFSLHFTKKKKLGENNMLKEI